MNLTKEYYDARKRAIAWLNGKQDFSEGSNILMDSGYKPHVAAKIAKWGNVPHSREKLEHEIRMMIRVWHNPDDPEHEDEEEVPTNEDIKVLALINKSGGDTEHPSLKEARIRCGVLFRQRGVLRKQLEAVGESNTPEAIQIRKELIQQIRPISEEIDRIYALIEEGEPLEDTEGKKDDDTNKVSEEEFTKEKLLQAKSNLKSTLTRAKNMLEYQQQKKAEQPNPMPEGPGRQKYLNKIERLNKELEEIEYKLAEFA